MNHCNFLMKFIEINNEINKSNLKFLYMLLKVREYSISHKEMPSFEEHSNFVQNHPYYKWFIIKIDSNLIGAIYIHKDNSIGLNILNQFEKLIPDILSFLEKRYKPLPYIKSVRSKNFFLNLSPQNKRMHDLLISSGYEISQISFEKKIF